MSHEREWGFSVVSMISVSVDIDSVSLTSSDVFYDFNSHQLRLLKFISSTYINLNFRLYC